MFSHQDFFHFLVNMFVFYSFGGIAIGALGTTRFLQLYLGGGLAAAWCQMNAQHLVPRSWPSFDHTRPLMGASGAVNALLAWYVFSFPTSRLMLYGIVPVPAALVGLGLLSMDLRGLYLGDSNVGNAAHIGGSVFGAAYFLVRKFALRR
jgi:membrane associated rhomboid family serine protease